VTPRCACGQPAPHATICTACERDLTAALITVLAVAPELEIALTRQAQFADRSHIPGYAAMLPYDERAAEAAAQLRGVLSGWVRVLTEAA
jgi:electron transfer flavoprotein alpha/beta subunit